jgi:hypothetical protein
MEDEDALGPATSPVPIDRRTDALVAFGVIVFGAIFLAGTTTIRTDLVADAVGPIILPRLVALFLIVGGSYIAIQNIRGFRRGTASTDEGAQDEPDSPASSRRAFTVMGLTLLFPALMVPLGFLLATPIYLSSAFYVLNERSRMVLIVVPIASSIGIYLLFGKVLRVNLPTGITLEFLRAVGLER